MTIPKKIIQLIVKVGAFRVNPWRCIGNSDQGDIENHPEVINVGAVCSFKTCSCAVSKLEARAV